MNDNIYEAGRNLQVASLVGLAKQRLGWHKVYHRLNKFPNAVDFDFSKFDKTVDRLSFKICMNVRLGMFSNLTPNLIKLVKSYYRDMINSLIVMEDGNIIYKRSGNSSGQPCTITENNLVNEFRWLYAWCALAPDAEYCNYSHWKENVELCVMGDDSILTVSDDVKSWYNPSAIMKIFSSHGWVSKIGDLQFKKLLDTEFCSLLFRKLPSGMVVPSPKYTGKYITSMLRGSKYNTVGFSCLRALAIRMDAYYNDEVFRLMDGYVQYLFQQYGQELRVGEDNLSYEDLVAAYKTAPQIENLYLSRQ